MNKYKIKFIFNEEKNIDNILIDVLNKKLKEYVNKFCKIRNDNIDSLHEDDGIC